MPAPADNPDSQKSGAANPQVGSAANVRSTASGRRFAVGRGFKWGGMCRQRIDVRGHGHIEPFGPRLRSRAYGFEPLRVARALVLHIERQAGEGIRHKPAPFPRI
jgi:hypothetical protein